MSIGFSDQLLTGVPVSPPGNWRYALHDLLTGQQLREHMPFTIEQPATRMLTEAGTVSVSLDVGDPQVQKLNPWGVILPRRTSLVLLRDEQVVGEWIVWNEPGYKASAKKMTLSCSELRDYFDKHRILRPEAGYGSRKTLAYTTADAFTIFRGLLADAQGVTYAGLPVGSLNIEADPATMSGVLVDRRDIADQANAYHGYEFPYYGALLDDLAAAAGFEWRIDSYLDQDNRLRRRLVLGHPHVGRPADDDSLTLEYPGTIADYGADVDGESSANYIAALGSGEEEAMIWGEAYNPSELTGGYPLLETTAAYKDDTSPTTAGQHAAAERDRLAGDVLVYSLDLIGYPNVLPGDYVRTRIADEARWPGSSHTPRESWVRVIGTNSTPSPKERTSLVIEAPRGVGSVS